MMEHHTEAWPGLLDDEERYLIGMINMLREMHWKSLRPYLDRLHQLRSHRTPESFTTILTHEQAIAMGFEVP